MDSSFALRGLCEQTMDSSFALRGLLEGSDSGFCGADGFGRLPSLEQLKGRKAAAQLPYGSSFRGQPNLSPRGTRAIHGSRAVSESAGGGFANRPLSPHIALKKPQMAATYSISHRIFGAAVASTILAIPILMKLSETFDI